MSLSRDGTRLLKGPDLLVPLRHADGRYESSVPSTTSWCVSLIDEFETQRSVGPAWGVHRVPCMIEVCPDSSGDAEGCQGPSPVAGGVA
jgi:hypothetical protein